MLPADRTPGTPLGTRHPVAVVVIVVCVGEAVVP
jgi:hypothetical protein